MPSGSKKSKDEFYDDDKRAYVGSEPVQIYGMDSQRMRKALKAGKDIVDNEKITKHHFKRD